VRFATQTVLLNAISERRRLQKGLEIGCGEGLFTETLFRQCESLLALDISTVALERAKQRQLWNNRIRFAQFDLRNDPIPGTFDLIVIASVLEYLARPGTFRRVREKLAAALQPGAYLMVETTRNVYPVGDDCWWCKIMPIGKWINFFIANHEALTMVDSVETDDYVITVYQKAPM
jgi:2-polyprenyl-3-methyl-5-hydroxy-6-metoxy-1,4-benzoquinol methylase